MRKVYQKRLGRLCSLRRSIAELGRILEGGHGEVLLRYKPGVFEYHERSLQAWSALPRVLGF